MTLRFRRGWGWLLLAALTLSTIGDEITLIVLMFRAAGEQMAYAVPVLLVAQLVPGLLAAPWIGRLTDRRDAARLLILASVAQAAVVAWMAWQSRLLATLVGAGLLGLCFAVSGTAAFTLIPVLARGLGMTVARANGALEVVYSAGMLVGPAVGGVLVAWSGARNALLIDAASFLLLAAVLWASGLRREGEPERGAGRPSLLGDYLPLLRNRRIVVMTGALALEVFATAIADVAFVFLVTASLGAGAAAFGALTACWAGGMLAGAAIAGRIADRRPADAAFAAGVVMGLTMLAIGVMPALMTASLLFVGGAFAIGGAANAVHNVAVRTMLQREAPPHAHGKVAAFYTASTRSAAILGFLAGGLFVPGGAYAAYVVGGVLGVAAGAGGWLLFVTLARPPAGDDR